MKCVSVEYINDDFDLCDLEIEGGSNNYIAEGIVVHNTWACFGYHPDSDIPIVTSKGLSGKGLAFRFNDANKTNLYVQTFKELNKDNDLFDSFWQHMTSVLTWDEWSSQDETPFYILGEIFGQGIQDLTYGTEKKLFRVFDIYVGEPGKGRYLDASDVENIVERMHNIEYVPVLYSGPFSKAAMEEYTNGRETVSGKEACIREGIVIRLETERRDDELGRIILKSVSEAYLLRKNATEFN